MNETRREGTMCHDYQNPDPRAAECHVPPFIPSLVKGFMHIIGSEGMNVTPYALEETDQGYLVTIPLPGHVVENIEVSAKDDGLLVEARRPAKTDPAVDGKQSIQEENKKILVSMARFMWDEPSVT